MTDDIFSTCKKNVCVYFGKQGNAGLVYNTFNATVGAFTPTYLTGKQLFVMVKQKRTEFAVRFLNSSFISVSSSCNQQVGFLASDGKSAKLGDFYWHLINHLQASLWGTRWHTYLAQNKPRHTVTLLRMIFLPLEVVCHFE